MHTPFCFFFFFFNDTATTEIYTLSLHDALPISERGEARAPRALAPLHRIPRHPHVVRGRRPAQIDLAPAHRGGDRKSTRLNSSHDQISYAVFCLKKKKKNNHKIVR